MMRTINTGQTVDSEFGTRITQAEIDDMADIVSEASIMNVFSDRNNIFGQHEGDLVHIDARYIGGPEDLHKIEVQRAELNGRTLGVAFVKHDVDAYLAGLDDQERPTQVHGLYQNLINALRRSMTEVKDTGSCFKYIVAQS